MDKAEFDKFAEEYSTTLKNNIRASGESPEFFAEYKIADVSREIGDREEIGRILDFGSGVGSSVPYFRRYFPRAELTCLDVSERSLQIAQQRFGDDARFQSFDGSVVPSDAGTFDLVFAGCVFHHIEHSEHAGLLHELNRVLRPGGHLFIFEHNPLNPLTRHAVNTCPFDENAVLIGGRSMERSFRKAGLSQVSLKYRIFFPGMLKALRVVEPYLTWLPLGAQYYVHGRKPS